MPLGTPSVYPFHIIPFHHNYLKWYICISVIYGIHYIVLQWNYHTVAGTSAPCHISFYSFLVNLILISAYMTRQMFSYIVSSIVFCLEETWSHWKKWHLSNRHLMGLGSMHVQMCVYVCVCVYMPYSFYKKCVLQNKNVLQHLLNINIFSFQTYGCLLKMCFTNTLAYLFTSIQKHNVFLLN